MKLMNKKGQIFDGISSLATGIAVLSITLVVVFLILSTTKANSTVAADQNATNALTSLQNAASGIPGWVPIVVVAVVGSLLLGLVALFRRG